MGNNRVELLAPAGGPAQLTAALACGADAVYLGAGSLNARRSATNFDGDALQEAIAACHTRGVKVHLTLNTLVLERELLEAEELAATACALGVDAIIVQDLGLARTLRRCAPTLPLHASTQMAVHNLAGVRMLESLGFSRVVLARELSRTEIAAIAQDARIETEVFLHGALCMCVSGQCYMSAVIGERSGNRGLCAQPCRLPFFVREDGRCGLSLKDLSLVEQATELRDLGVTALKIEGRMKRPEYVAAAVTACRQALDGQKPDLDTLRSVFSRSGFTDGYYTGRVDPQMFGVRQKEDVVAAQTVLGDLARLYQRETQRVSLDGELVLELGQPVILTIHDPDGHTIAVTGDAPEPARSKPTTAELAEQSLNKLGGTPYGWNQLTVKCGEGLAMPVSRLNALRREAIDALTEERGKQSSIPWEPYKDTAKRLLPVATPGLRARFARLDQIPAGYTEQLDAVILPVGEAVRVEDPALLQKLIVELPRIDFADGRTTQSDLVRLRESGVTRAAAGNLGAIQLATALGFAVCGDWALNLTNSRSLAQLGDLGCVDATVSWELNLADARRLTGPIPRGLVAYGHLPLMIVRNCPARAEKPCAACNGMTRMTDRKGNRFYVSCGGARGMVEVYNHLPLFLADRLGELQGMDFLTLLFTVETRATCAEVIRAYQTGGERPEAITRGLYYRNIL